MKRNIEVIYNILPLLATIEEAFFHVKKQLSELRYEESFILVQDSILAITSIELAINPMNKQIRALKNNEVLQAKEYLNNCMNEVLSLYKKKRYDELEQKIDITLNAFYIWKNKIEQAIQPKVIS